MTLVPGSRPMFANAQRAGHGLRFERARYRALAMPCRVLVSCCGSKAFMCCQAGSPSDPAQRVLHNSAGTTHGTGSARACQRPSPRGSLKSHVTGSTRPCSSQSRRIRLGDALNPKPSTLNPQVSPHSPESARESPRHLGPVYVCVCVCVFCVCVYCTCVSKH